MIETEYSISAGGSLFFGADREISSPFITRLASFFTDFSKKGYRFHLVCGGGKLARLYIDGARQAGVTDPQELDALGISATHLNAQLLYATLKAQNQKITYNFDPFLEQDSVISVTGGCGAGHTTDYVAVKIAMIHGLDKVINLTDVNGIHSQKEPELDRNNIISELTWNEFLLMKQELHTPGINTPFDPEAARLAQQNNISAVIINGHNLINLGNCLEGKEFIGTFIRPN